MTAPAPYPPPQVLITLISGGRFRVEIAGDDACVVDRDNLLPLIGKWMEGAQ